MNYYQLTFTYDAAIECEIISDILAAELGEIGFESFTQHETGLAAYVPEKLYDKTLLDEKLATFPLDEVTINYTSELIPAQDWNEEWEKNYFKPIVIGNQCVIRASFHQPVAGVTYDIVIDPRMAFGTGNHETTYLMLNEILKLDLHGKEVLDMGCGTAVLAILSAMKGASRIVAIDIDEWAYNNTLDNIRLNATTQVDVKLGGAEQIATSGKFDILFANINRNILLNDIRHYATAMKPGSMLFMSGFYTHDIPAIKAESSLNGLRYLTHAERNNWVAVQFIKES